MRHRFLSWLFWSWLSYTSLNMNIFITFSEPFTFRFCLYCPFLSFSCLYSSFLYFFHFLSLLWWSLFSSSSVYFSDLLCTWYLSFLVFLCFSLLLWTYFHVLLFLTILLFTALSFLVMSISFFPFRVFNIAPLISVCANFKLRKSEVSQPNFHCTLIYFCIKHVWGVSKHMVFDLVFTFSNIFWHFFDISTRGFLSGPGSYQPCLRGNDRVGQIHDSSTDVQFKLYKLFNGKKMEYCMNFNK